MTTKRIYTLPLALFITLQLIAQISPNPPSMPVRTMAEWEELQALVITWNGDNWRNTLTEITRAAREECNVIIICNNQNTVTSAQNYLLSKGVDISSNVTFFIAANNSIWVRDYGPTCVYANGVDSLLTIDWIYNRQNRALDNVIPEKLGQLLDLPVFSTTIAPYDLANTGGNFMSDGMGTAFASNLVLRNNDQIANGEGTNTNDIFGTSNHTATSIDNILQEYMGISRYIKMEELPFDGIHHIDMHMKLLDEETILMGEYPANTSDGPQIEANLQYVLANNKTSFGNDFKVIRIPMPPFSGQHPPFSSAPYRYPTYANAVFVNQTVIIPKYNIPFDAAAQDTFQKYLPGYKIVAVDCVNIIDSGGAVHCITKEIGVADPLLIVHSALPCQNNLNTVAYQVSADIKHRSGIADAKIWYTTDLNLPWQSTGINLTGGQWLGQIPKQTVGSTVYYYISAIAQNGKTVTRPMTAPEGYWSFCVFETVGVTESPQIEWEDIYPNPASAITVIPLKSNQRTPAQISLLNLLGQEKERIFAGELPAGQSKYFFDARKYAPGVYFVEIQTNSTRVSRKVVIR